LAKSQCYEFRKTQGKPKVNQGKTKAKAQVKINEAQVKNDKIKSKLKPNHLKINVDKLL